MQYKSVQKATFRYRPNRFIAICTLYGEDVTVHVKNTGRCKELLVPGCTVYLSEAADPARKTRFDLIAVRKGDALFNIDSAAPNRVFGEWLAEGVLFPDITFVRHETVFQDSRFDFYVEHGGRRAFIEVKGVTLEENGVLLFPDAPTERGIKHVKGLCDAIDAGYDAYVAFIIQTEQATYFTPNRETHPAFAHALSRAAEKGVGILCYTCHVTKDSLSIAAPLPYRL